MDVIVVAGNDLKGKLREEVTNAALLIEGARWKE